MPGIREKGRRTLAKDGERIDVLEKTQKEQAELKAKVEEGRKRLADEIRLAADARQWGNPYRSTGTSPSWTLPP